MSQYNDLGVVNATLASADELDMSPAGWALFEHSGLPMKVLEPSGEYVAVNAEFERIVGYSSEDLRGRHFTDFCFPEFVDAEWTLFQELAAGRRLNYRLEKRLRSLGGHHLWVAIRGFLMPARLDGRFHIYGMVVDLTQQRLAEAKTDALVEYAPYAKVIVDGQGRITRVNLQTEELLGYDRDELVGRPIEILIPERFRTGHPALRRLFSDRPETRAMGKGRDLYALAKDGREIPVEINLAPIIVPEIAAPETLVICAIRDITSRKRAAAAIEQHAARLARSNADLEQFAYSASHDLQEPLRKIRAFGERLSSGARESLDEKDADYLDRMVDAASRMQRLIEDLLDYSRASTREQQFGPVDLGEVLNEVLGDLELVIEQVGAQVEIGEMAVIDSDPSQMRQLLQNLISNALTYRREDVVPSIRIWTKRPESALPSSLPGGKALLELTVSDNGIGFDPKYAERIFGVFQRLHGRGKYKGTGVGLAICKRIAERHGGTIMAHGVPGEGATFLVILPVVHSAEENWQ